MKRVLGILAFAVVAWATATPADAALYIRFCAGAGPCAGPGTTGPAPVLTVGPTNVGGFTILSSSVASNEPGTPTNASAANTNIFIQNNSAVPGTVTIEFSATDFMQPSGIDVVGASLSASGAPLVGTTTVTGQGFADDSNAAFGFAVPTAPPLVCSGLLGSLAGDCSGLSSSTTVTTLNGPFSLSGRTTILLQAGSILQTTLSVSANAVPEPGSLMLLGSGLFGLAGAARRRFGRVQA